MAAITIAEVSKIYTGNVEAIKKMPIDEIKQRVDKA
eukprot:gene15851-20256_t